MVGTLVKWRLSWILLIALSLLDVWGAHWIKELGNNYGLPEQRWVDALTAFNYFLPLAGFFWFRHLLKANNGLWSKIVLWTGWGAILSAGIALLFLLSRSSSHEQTPLTGALDLWRLSGSLIWLFPLGVWGIQRSGFSKPKHSLVYSSGAAALAIASFVIVQWLGWDAAKSLAPVWGFAFVVEVLLLCAASVDKQSIFALLIAISVVAVVAYLLRFLIFFAGIFYGGGMLHPMFIAFAIAFVFLIELLVIRNRTKA